MKPKASSVVSVAAAGVVVVAAYFGGGIINERLSAKDGAVWERPLHVLGVDLSVSIRLATAPAPSSGDYFGFLAPFVLIAYTGPGGLNQVLNHAWVTPVANTGIDACGGPLFYDSFSITDPTAAGNQTTNVTYASDSYPVPQAFMPGSEECALRFNVAGEWIVRLCVELDGVLEQPTRGEGGGVGVDAYDFCVMEHLHGSL